MGATPISLVRLRRLSPSAGDKASVALIKLLLQIQFGADIFRNCQNQIFHFKPPRPPPLTAESVMVWVSLKVKWSVKSNGFQYIIYFKTYILKDWIKTVRRNPLMLIAFSGMTLKDP